MASIVDQRYGVGDIVILDDDTLAIVREVYEQYDEWFYTVEPRGEGVVPVLTNVAQYEIKREA